MTDVGIGGGENASSTDTLPINGDSQSRTCVERQKYGKNMIGQ